ncbi:hypothetical protein [Legionella fallonii]|uniref:Ankyrin repeat protein n=1 Tax=Legionella fallonii LLAP-10 TaxID=1212491 RepID=A0A098G372_9GAMM|nr:hypothetical protein [Legionella fallonii]CEG56431.1 protein of unknown function [Legionella fallonii LLAP-10]
MSLWQAMSDKNYGVVQELIKKKPTLVNATQERTGSSLLMVALNLKEKPLELIRFIITHKNFDLFYMNPETEETNMAAILSEGRLDILKMAKNHPDFLIKNDKLLYQTVNAQFNMAKRAFENNNRKDPQSAATARNRTKMNSLKEMADYLCDLTIRHAIATDDTTILEQLEKLDVDLTSKLLDGTNPQDLLTEKNSKIDAAKFQSFESLLAEMSSSQSSEVPGRRAETMKEQRRLEESAKALTAIHQQKQTKIMRDAVEKKTQVVAKVNSPHSH